MGSIYPSQKEKIRVRMTGVATRGDRFSHLKDFLHHIFMEAVANFPFSTAVCRVLCRRGPSHTSAVRRSVRQAHQMPRPRPIASIMVPHYTLPLSSILH